MDLDKKPYKNVQNTGTDFFTIAKNISRVGIFSVKSVILTIVAFSCLNIVFFMAAVIKIVSTQSFDGKTWICLASMLATGILFVILTGYLAYKQAIQKVISKVFEQLSTPLLQACASIAKQVAALYSQTPLQKLKTSNLADLLTTKFNTLPRWLQKALFGILLQIPVAKWIQQYLKGTDKLHEESLRDFLFAKSNNFVLQELLGTSSTWIYICLVCNVLLQGCLLSHWI